MTPEQIEKLRAQFEAWALTQGMDIERHPPSHRLWPGQYKWTTPHRDWTVWQACARLVAADTWERAAELADEANEDYAAHRNYNMAGAAKYIAGCIRTAAAKEPKS